MRSDAGGCNGIVNNYLASIAARTVNPAPPVRPRLGGRFEPAPVSRDGSIDRPELDRAASQNPFPETEIERAALSEIRHQRAPGEHREKSFYVAPEPDAVEFLQREQKSTAGSQPIAMDAAALSASSTIRPPSEQTSVPKPKPALQVVHIEVPSVEPAIDPEASLEIGSSSVRQLSERDWAESRSEHDTDPKTVPRRHKVAGQERFTAITEQTSRAIRPSLSKHDEEEHVLQPPIARTKPTIGSESQTVVKPAEGVLDDSAGRNDPGTKPVPVPIVAPSSDVRGGSKGLPVFVQSRIVPPAELGAERLSLNRPGVQPQPTVHVTIGRIEVRAAQSSQSPAKPRATPPVMNLDDYLRRRNQGSAR